MKRFVAVSAITLVVVAGLVAVIAQISPLPSVFAIRYVFSQGDAAAMSALERHVPPGVSERLNLPYGDGPDERFDIFRPQGNGDALPVIVWVHGGGWVAGSKEGVGNYARILASHGYAVIALDYTVAPAARYPTQTGQVMASLAHFVAQAQDLGIDPDRIVLAGDSAGAQIAAQVAAIIAAPEYGERIGVEPAISRDRLAAILLFCGAYSVDGIELDGQFGWFLRTVLWAYTGTRDFMNDPAIETASVVNFVTEAFPPTFITGGNADPLTPQSIHLAERLTAKGVPVEALFFPIDHEPPLQHEYQFNLDIDAGQDALDRILDFLERRVSQASSPIISSGDG